MHVRVLLRGNCLPCWVFYFQWAELGPYSTNNDIDQRQCTIFRIRCVFIDLELTTLSFGHCFSVNSNPNDRMLYLPNVPLRFIKLRYHFLLQLSFSESSLCQPRNLKKFEYHSTTLRLEIKTAWFHPVVACLSRPELWQFLLCCVIIPLSPLASYRAHSIRYVKWLNLLLPPFLISIQNAEMKNHNFRGTA